MRFAKSGRSGPLAICAALAALSAAPCIAPSTAVAQVVQVTTEFHPVLDHYGRWVRNAKWGEVWIPARRAANWRPYEAGHWLYTDEWGWYWVSADEEADWGWITYHYGRWIFDRAAGWMWIPGNQWAPAWVDWRRGDTDIGWAPLPPDEVITTVREQPDYWVFVRTRDLLAPRIATVILPAAQRTVIIKRTVVVNRTVIVRDRNIVVNPGIPPAYIAKAVGRPIRAYDVKPRVVIGTRNVPGAVEVRVTPGRTPPKVREKVEVKQTATIQPAATVPPPRALGRDEHGRLGQHPPRAAQGAAQPNRPNGPANAQPNARPNAPAAPGATPSNREQRQERREQRQPSNRPEQRPAQPQRPEERAAPRSQPQRPEQRTPPRPQPGPAQRPPRVEHPTTPPAARPQPPAAHPATPPRPPVVQHPTAPPAARPQPLPQPQRPQAQPALPHPQAPAARPPAAAQPAPAARPQPPRAEPRREAPAPQRREGGPGQRRE